MQNYININKKLGEKMKIEEHLDWKYPTIYYQDSQFFVTIDNNAIEIEYSNENKKTKMYISFEIFDEMIDKIKNAVKK